MNHLARPLTGGSAGLRYSYRRPISDGARIHLNLAYPVTGETLRPEYVEASERFAVAIIAAIFRQFCCPA
jgi:hypothetical protein